MSWSALVDRVHGAVVYIYPCTYARMCVSMCVCVEHNCEVATAVNMTHHGTNPSHGSVTV